MTKARQEKAAPATLGVTFRREGSMIRLAGYFDEVADYGPLLALQPPLRLDLREVRAVNSHGLRKWIRFIRDYGNQSLELHACPVPFIEAANMIPDVVSATGNMKRIKSVLTPFRCLNCRRSVLVIVETADVTVMRGETVEVPDAGCPKCGEAMQLEVDPDDHFLFWTCD